MVCIFRLGGPPTPQQTASGAKLPRLDDVAIRWPDSCGWLDGVPACGGVCSRGPACEEPLLDPSWLLSSIHRCWRLSGWLVGWLASWLLAAGGCWTAVAVLAAFRDEVMPL